MELWISKLWMALEWFGDWVDFGTRECKGLKGGGGAGVLREPMDSNRSFPVMSTLRIVWRALEIFWHILDLARLACPV